MGPPVPHLVYTIVCIQHQFSQHTTLVCIYLYESVDTRLYDSIYRPEMGSDMFLSASVVSFRCKTTLAGGAHEKNRFEALALVPNFFLAPIQKQRREREHTSIHIYYMRYARIRECQVVSVCAQLSVERIAFIHPWARLLLLKMGQFAREAQKIETNRFDSIHLRSYSRNSDNNNKKAPTNCRYICIWVRMRNETRRDATSAM